MVVGSWTFVPKVYLGCDGRVLRALISWEMVLSVGADVVNEMSVVTTIIADLIGRLGCDCESLHDPSRAYLIPDNLRRFGFHVTDSTGSCAD